MSFCGSQRDRKERSRYILARRRADCNVALFYMTDSPSSVRSFLAHSNKIGILVPAWYLVDGNGLVSGGPNPLVLEAARMQHLPVMPIIGNSGKDALHFLLANRAAQSAMIASPIREAKKYGYVGIQIDFEDLSWTDCE